MYEDEGLSTPYFKNCQTVSKENADINFHYIANEKGANEFSISYYVNVQRLITFCMFRCLMVIQMEMMVMLLMLLVLWWWS